MLTMEYLRTFCREYGYPAEAEPALLAGLERVRQNAPLWTTMTYWWAAYDRDGEKTDLDAAAKELPDKAGDDLVRTAMLLFYIGCCPRLRELYQAQGLSEEQYQAAIDDLRLKALDCVRVHGEWGTFVWPWFPRFFQLTRFAFGCLQFETFAMPDTYTVDGVTLEKGQLVINVHIPGGAPLLPEAVKASFRQAAAFYADRFTGEYVPMVCHSWLLFPPNQEILPTGSRILQFMDEFTVVAEERDAANYDVWRIFPTTDASQPENLPRDTSVQRAYADWLMAGNCMGEGFGIHLEPRADG